MGAAVWRSLSARERVLDELFDHRNDLCLLFASRRRTLLLPSPVQAQPKTKRISTCQNRINLVPHEALTFLWVSSEGQSAGCILSLLGQRVSCPTPR